MAGKEATVYIVDLGASTGECHSGRIESDLDYGMRYVWEKIAMILSTNRATLLAGVVGFRTDQTEHDLDLEGYENIWVMKPLEAIKMNHLKDLQRNIKPSHTDSGDALSAIVVAVDMIEKATTLKSGGKGKFDRKIVLLTDGLGLMDGTDVEAIVQKINESEITLVVIGVDFDDAEYGFKEEDKSLVKKENEALLKKMTEDCKNGVFGTAAEAIETLSIPEVKITKPYTSYRGKLSLGDWKTYENTAMYIDVQRCFRTKIAKPISGSSFVTRYAADGATSGRSSHTIAGDMEMGDTPFSGGGLAAVKNSRAYKVNDAENPSGKKEVDREDLAKGFEYGRTAVHISESDENVTKLETFQEFTIIGFIPSDKYERFLNMAESCITIAESTNDKARLALSSFIHALHELDSYAVARIVTKEGGDPRILLLAPSIEPDLEALIDVPLPFAEDVRVYRFPPLDRVITTSGATLTKHRNIPSSDLVDAMSDYVDSMDLSNFGRDEDGEPAEYMAIEDTYSPTIHRVNQAIRRRAVQPEEAVAPPADILVKYSHPPAELVSQSASQLHSLEKVADVKKVLPKVKGKKRRETVNPISGLDVEALLGQEKRRKISKDNAISEFRQMLADAEKPETIIDAAKQMTGVTRELIMDSMADRKYEQVIENMSVMREEMIECEEPETYNKFIRNLKRDLLEGNLGGDRRELWWKIKGRRLGLIDAETAEKSKVSEELAKEFLRSMSVELPARSTSD